MKISIEGLRFFMSRYLRLLRATDKLLFDVVAGQFSVGSEVVDVEGIIRECEKLIQDGVLEVNTAENEG